MLNFNIGLSCNREIETLWNRNSEFGYPSERTTKLSSSLEMKVFAKYKEVNVGSCFQLFVVFPQYPQPNILSSNILSSY